MKKVKMYCNKCFNTFEYLNVPFLTAAHWRKNRTYKMRKYPCISCGYNFITILGFKKYPPNNNYKNIEKYRAIGRILQKDNLKKKLK